MIEIELRARTTAMRHKLKLDDYHGNFEEIKFDIEYANTMIGREKPDPVLRGRERKAELLHSAKPSLNLAERLASNPSFRNAVRI